MAAPINCAAMVDLSLRLRCLRPVVWLLRASSLLFLQALPVLLVALVFPATAGRAEPSHPIVDPSPSPPLLATERYRVLGSSELAFLRDPGGRLDIDDVRSPDHESRFSPVGHGLRLSFTDDTVWLRVRLQRAVDAPEVWRLELTATYLNDVLLFMAETEGGYAQWQAGDRHSFQDRQVLYRRPAFDLHLDDAQPRTFFVRLRSDSPLTLDLLAWQPGRFNAAVRHETLWIGAVLGIALISVLFFLQAWRVNRDRLLLLSAGVSAMFALAASSNLGLVSQYLLPGHPGLADGGHPFVMAAFFSMLFALFRFAVDPRHMLPRFGRLHLAASALCVAGACMRPLGWYGLFGGKLMMMGILGGLLWVTALGWLMWRARRGGLALALSLSALATLFAVGPLMALDLLPPTRHFELFWAASCVGFIWVAQVKTVEEVRWARAQQREAARHEAAERDRRQRESGWRREQAEYFAGVAHDLRTPLGTVRVALANLERLLSTASGELREQLARLKPLPLRIAVQLSRHLTLQRLEQPIDMAAPALAPLAACLAQARAAAGAGLAEDRIVLRIHPDVPQAVTMDSELVAVALAELLRNADAAAPAGTAVELEVVCEGEGVALCVRDRGCGLQGGALGDWLLLPWQRASHASAHNAGFGLATVQRVAAVHRGRLSYRREPPDVSVLTLWLPIERNAGRPEVPMPRGADVRI